MIRQTLSYVASVTGGTLAGADATFVGVTTDSRHMSPGGLFIPLIGERFDGHDYCETAVEYGAAGFLWKKGTKLPDALRFSSYVEVDDTQKALQDLAKAYRKSLPIKVVGVTGSNGKTSTKDLLAGVLSQRYNTYKTEGNFNNHIGLPLSILSLDDSVEIAVLEMGMSGLGEISVLADIAKPEIGVITNIGEAHIGLLGSRDAIAQAKWELIASLPAGGVAILPADEPLLESRVVPAGVRTLWIGDGVRASLTLQDYHSEEPSGSSFKIAGSPQIFHLPVPGAHQARNALSAIAVGDFLGVSREDAARGLANVALTKMRMEVLAVSDKLVIINDAYNAAPLSVRAALDVLKDSIGDVRIAVLGDMLELGDETIRMHEEVGAAAAISKADVLLAVGQFADSYARGWLLQQGDSNRPVRTARTAKEAAQDLKQVLAQYGDKRCVVLVKGSRRVGLEHVVDVLK